MLYARHLLARHIYVWYIAYMQSIYTMGLAGTCQGGWLGLAKANKSLKNSESAPQNSPGRFGILAAPSYSWLLLAVPGCSWLRLAAPGCSWLLLAASGCSWLLLAAPGCSWLLLAVPGCSWLLLAAHGCSCLLLVTPGCSWLLLAAPGCSWLHGTGAWLCWP